MGRLAFDRPILVVDDTASTRYSTCRILAAAGAAVLEAPTGSDALRLAPECAAVVLDVNLPDIDGFTVCRELRAQPATAHLPVIHLTAQYLEDADKAHGLDAGADAYLTHPVDPGVFIATLNALQRMRRAENLEARARARFEAVFRTAPVGIALVADDGRVLDSNAEFGAIFGVAPDAGAVDALPEMVQAAHAHGRASTTGTHHWSTTSHDGGKVMHLDWHVSRIGTDSSLIVVVDNSEKHALELERAELLERERSARADAEEANRAKDTFLALLSHELRNPLNAISMWASVLRRPGAAARLQEGLDGISRSVALQARLVGDLLDVARLSTGKLELVLALVSPAAIVRDVLMAAGELLSGKGVDLRTDLDDALLVSADAARLHQMVWNLVSNAIKFSRRGGTVALTLAEDAGDMVLRVTDEGAGIAPEFLPFVFDRFRQSQGSRDRRHGGLGLGLSVVRSLVEMHGGSVDAASPGPDRGSTFTLRLPLHADTRAAAATDMHAPLRGQRILVLEDSDDLRQMLALVLEQYGAEVLQCASVEDALATLQAHVPTLILSDIGLPGRDGLQFIRELRSGDTPHARTPAIAITAFARDVDVEHALAAGFQRHLAKPVEANRLLDTMLAVLNEA